MALPRRFSKTRPVTWKVGLAALGISFLWSGNIVAIKFGLTAIPPFWSAFWRMAVGAAAVTLWTVASGKPVLIARNRLRPMLALAALFAVQICVFNLSVFYTSPAYAVILLNTNPVLVNLISHFYVKDDRVTPMRLAGLCIAFGGVAYVMFGHPEAELAPHPLLGNSLMLVSAALLAIRIVYTQRIVIVMDPLRPVIWQMILALPCFLGLAWYFEPPLTQPLTYVPVLAILYQALVVAGVCFVVWTTLLRRHSAGNLAMYSFSVPLFGVILSAVFFGERITGRLFFGAMAVAAGIAVVTKARLKGASA